MRIGVNTRFLLPQKLEGLGWYTYEILQRIVKLMPEHDFVFFFDRPYDEKFIFSSNITPVVINPPARHPILWYLWFEHALPKAMKKQKVDVFFSPDGYLSLKTNIPTVLSIHDLAFEVFPKQIPFLVAKYYTFFTPKFAKKAAQIVAVSTSTKNDLIRFYGIEEKKITVVSNGCSAQFNPVPSNIKEEIKNKWTEGHPFFIFIGAMHPRKNIEGIFKAFDLFKTKTGLPHKMLIAGRMAWGTASINTTFETLQFKKDIVFTAHSERDLLNNLLGSAEVLVYPSFYEGFGLPILEAFHCGVPVITANNSSMPEVGGDAALLVEANEVESITDSMIKIVENEQLRKELIEKGHQQKLLFSWDKAAEKIAGILQKTANSNGVFQ